MPSPHPALDQLMSHPAITSKQARHKIAPHCIRSSYRTSLKLYCWSWERQAFHTPVECFLHRTSWRSAATQACTMLSVTIRSRYNSPTNWIALTARFPACTCAHAQSYAACWLPLHVLRHGQWHVRSGRLAYYLLAGQPQLWQQMNRLPCHLAGMLLALAAHVPHLVG